MGDLIGLTERLSKRGFLASATAKNAFRAVDPGRFVLPRYHFLAYEDTPVPFHQDGAVGLVPSRRFAAILLGLANPSEAGDLIIHGSEGGYVASLFAHAAPDRSIVIVEGDAVLADATARNVERQGLEEVRVERDLPAGEVPLILQLRANPESDSILRHHLAEMGTLLTARSEPRGHELIQVVRNEGAFAELAIRETNLTRGGRKARSVNVSSLLAIEDLLGHVWTGDASPRDVHLRELVDSTFAGGPWDTSRLAPDGMNRSHVARTVFRLAHIHQMLGDLENAERLYRRSLEAFPTSEAHTFLGWTYSFLNRLEDAMRECREAIDVDPTLGNPYNDMGAYLIELGRPDEAVPWLKKATRADRYCCAFYAHCNLGRVYMLRGDLVAAREQFARALDVNPEYELARRLLEEVEKHL